MQQYCSASTTLLPSMPVDIRTLPRETFCQQQSLLLLFNMYANLSDMYLLASDNNSFLS